MPQFPLLSKCMLLQALCADSGDSGGDAIELPGFPGGAEAFEACAKFCYGITITVSARNLVPLRCAAAHLGMSEAADRGNLAAKLDAFLASCLLRRWKDALGVLSSTRHYAPLCEDLGLTSRCVEAVAILITDLGSGASEAAGCSSSPWWARDVSELGVVLFWRVMVATERRQASISVDWLEPLAPMTASSSPAHTSPEMLPAPLRSPHGVPPATQPAGRRGRPSLWRPFPRQHGFPRRRSSLPRPGATAASRSGPRASQLPPHLRRHPTGSRQHPGDASAGDRIGKSERRGIGGGDDERGRLRLP